MKPGIRKRMFIYPLIYILFGVFLFFRQRAMIYYPTPHESHPYTEITLNNDGESIKVIVLNPGGENAIVYFGGNAEAVVYNAYDFERCFPDHTVYLFNYRGYGGSSGKPTENGIFSDVLAFYDRIRPDHKSISAIGRSLGSGVAVYLASQREIAHLALVAPFDSISRVAQWQFPIYPISLLLLDKYDSFSRIREVKAQTLVIRGGNDRVIKARHTRRLISAFPEEQVSVFTIEDAGHNDIQGFAEYHRKLREFLTSE